MEYKINAFCMLTPLLIDIPKTNNKHRVKIKAKKLAKARRISAKNRGPKDRIRPVKNRNRNRI